MLTNKTNVINWRNGLITTQQAREIEKIEKDSDNELFYKGQSVRDASAFIIDYQETVNAKIKHDNSNEDGPPWLSLIGLTLILSAFLIIDILL